MGNLLNKSQDIFEVEMHTTYGMQTAYVDKFGCVEIILPCYLCKSIRMDVKDLKALIDIYNKIKFIEK